MKRLFDKNKSKLRQIRHLRVRKVVMGTAAVPRLSVFRSNRGMTAQLIDDAAGKTLCYASAAEVKDKKAADKTGKTAISYNLGNILAGKAKAKGISKARFDRGGYKYHGRVKALADGARDGGLVF
jgi:large subunit ribosomal protein L18